MYEEEVAKKSKVERERERERELRAWGSEFVPFFTSLYLLFFKLFVAFRPNCY